MHYAVPDGADLAHVRHHAPCGVGQTFDQQFNGLGMIVDGLLFGEIIAAGTAVGM